MRIVECVLLNALSMNELLMNVLSINALLMNVLSMNVLSMNVLLLNALLMNVLLINVLHGCPAVKAVLEASRWALGYLQAGEASSHSTIEVSRLVLCCLISRIKGFSGQPQAPNDCPHVATRDILSSGKAICSGKAIWSLEAHRSVHRSKFAKLAALLEHWVTHGIC